MFSFQIISTLIFLMTDMLSSLYIYIGCFLEINLHQLQIVQLRLSLGQTTSLQRRTIYKEHLKNLLTQELMMLLMKLSIIAGNLFVVVK